MDKDIKEEKENLKEIETLQDKLDNAENSTEENDTDRFNAMEKLDAT